MFTSGQGANTDFLFVQEVQGVSQRDIYSFKNDYMQMGADGESARAFV
jgi:hypothetical protein